MRVANDGISPQLVNGVRAFNIFSSKILIKVVEKRQGLEKEKREREKEPFA